MEDRKRLSKSQRQEIIVSGLRASSNIRVMELADEFAVSTETIRRDLEELEARGLLDRTYGGAVRPMGHEPALSERYRMMVREREAIAGIASGLIKRGDVVLLGAGATTLYVARRISAEQKDITVITHAFDLIAALATNTMITVLSCPGRYNPAEGFLYGPETVEFLKTFNANYAFLGASGMTVEGPSDVNADAAAIYRAMIERASQTIIVADHSKFGRPSLARWARWKEVDRLITDVTPPAALAAALKESNVEVSITES